MRLVVKSVKRLRARLGPRLLLPVQQAGRRHLQQENGLAMPELPQALLRLVPEEDRRALLQEARLSRVPRRDERGRHPHAQDDVITSASSGRSLVGHPRASCGDLAPRVERPGILRYAGRQDICEARTRQDQRAGTRLPGSGRRSGWNHPRRTLLSPQDLKTDILGPGRVCSSPLERTPSRILLSSAIHLVIRVA
jgi:hypothetical protein